MADADRIGKNLKYRYFSHSIFILFFFSFLLGFGNKAFSQSGERETPAGEDQLFVAFSLDAQDLTLQILPELKRLSKLNPNAQLIYLCRSLPEGTVEAAFNTLFPNGVTNSYYPSEGRTMDSEGVFLWRAQIAGQKVHIIGNTNNSEMVEIISSAKRQKLETLLVKVQTLEVARQGRKHLYVAYSAGNYDYDTQIRPEIEKLARENPEAILALLFNEELDPKQESAIQEEGRKIHETLKRHFPNRHIYDSAKGDPYLERLAVLAGLAAEKGPVDAQVYILGANNEVHQSKGIFQAAGVVRPNIIGLSSAIDNQIKQREIIERNLVESLDVLTIEELKTLINKVIKGKKMDLSVDAMLDNLKAERIKDKHMGGKSGELRGRKAGRNKPRG